ncbi:MAG TPA: DUF2232 domain-containing protein [Cyanobacteria bacterium UBA8803]|nr:DUF2232 domain-containing protein [Cyanobacteria bacterium UBA9273]HBL61614.1 DUF2232 domain-containing protein [Cyanobacteria bacterium UBA8803]
MSDPCDDAQSSHRDLSEETENQPLKSEAAEDFSDNFDLTENELTEDTNSDRQQPVSFGSHRKTPFPGMSSSGHSTHGQGTPLVMVETAFLASTASLIWLINYYFPLGPVLKMFFPVPIALVYLRWGNRASWMAALVSGLLLAVLQGPARSILFVIPYGLMGVQLGALWRRQAHWLFSIGIGTLIGTVGFFFRFWLLSILLNEDLWVYVMTQVTELVEWGCLKLGLLIEPSLLLIQAIALVTIFLNNAVYLFVVHLVALLMFDRLGNPIPRPPNWVQILLDYDG